MVLAQDYWSSAFTTDTYPFSTPTSKTKLWDPTKTLGIINVDPGYEGMTCNGHAPTQKRRCGNPINQSNRTFITSILDEISYLDPNSPPVLPRLRTIAGPALCRAHQCQTEELVRQWQQKISALRPVPRFGGGGGEKKSGKSFGVKREFAETSRNAKRDGDSEDRTLKEIRDQMREMREMIANLQSKLAEKSEDQDSGCGTGEEPMDRYREEQERIRRREARERETKKKEREEQERIRRKEEEEEVEARRKEKERLEKEKREKEEREQRRKEEAAEQNERIRQRAQKRREEAEREWTDAWTKYQQSWVIFRTSTSTETDIRNSIPWPVKSGSYRDVNASSVKEFLETAMPKDEDKAKVFRKECRKWHPDMIRRLPRANEMTDVDEMRCDMICRVVTDLLNSCAGRSSEFVD